MKKTDNYQFIFVVGMNRSGSTWSYNVVRSLLEADNWKYGYRGEGDELDNYIRNVQGNGDKLLLKFHEPTDLVMELISSGKAKAIYTQRDLRDVTISLMNFIKKSFRDLLDGGALSDIIETHKLWVQNTHLCRIEYNATQRTPEAVVRTIAHYLAVNLNENTANLIAYKNNKENTLARQKGATSSKNSEWSFNEESLLHETHISDGGLNRFEVMFNKNELDEFNHKYSEFLVNEGYLSGSISNTVVSYSQNFEDVLLNRVFENKSSGFYIDVGAADPEFLSVTKHFYDKGWNGINIDPILANYQALTLERPRDINVNVGLSNAKGSLEFYESSVGEFSGFSHDGGKLAEDILKQADGTKYNVDVITLSDLYSQYGERREVDFLKIDVEGWEKNVLEGWDSTLLRPKVIVVEAIVPFKELKDHFHNINEIGTWHQWENLLFDAQYEFVYFDGLNRFYIRSESPELRDFFQVPVSPVHDQFIFCSTENMSETQKMLLPALFRSQGNTFDENSGLLIKTIEDKEACIQEQNRQLQEKEACTQEQSRQLQEKEACIQEQEVLLNSKKWALKKLFSF